MVHRIIEDIEMPFFLWKKLNKKQRINKNIAFDTETIEGKAFLIADSNGNFDHEEHFKDLYGLLQFLNSKEYRSTVNWFYNLEYDTNAILKFLSIDDRRFIAEFNYVDYEGFRIHIIPRKELKISHIKNDKISHTTAFFDLAQFYGFKKLALLAQQTEFSKVYVSDISQISLYKYYNDKEYYKLINNRCIIDSKITVQLANKLTWNIQKVVGLNNYRSNASISRRYVLENIKKDLEMPSIKMMDVALKTYHAGHIETCKIGLFDNIHNYDIKSAYPSQIAELYETKGNYLHNKEYEPDTAYSFYYISVDYENDFLSPIWYLKTNKNYHVTGRIETWVSQSEIEYFMFMGYDIKILQAYHIKKTKYVEQPFYNIIHDLYNERLKAKDNTDEIELVYKIILNSIYGVTLNTIHKKVLADYETDLYDVVDGQLRFYDSQYKATNMYNPVYGTTITANTRAKIFTDFNKGLDKVIAFSTDGIYSTGKTDVKISEFMGDYGYANYENMMFLGSGRYFIYEDGNINDDKSRFRSIPKKASEIETIMKDNKLSETIKLVREKPIKLKESLKNSKYYGLTFSSFPAQDYYLNDQFNVFNKVEKDIYFKTERRFWFDKINKIDDLWDRQLSSRPFNINELT